MTPAAAAILDGMPDPSLLHRADRDGTTWILAGSVVLACYPSGDAGLRNVAVAVCLQLGFSGRAVAEMMGLTENYVATLHNRALREGTAGLVRAPGRPASWPGTPGSRRPGGGPGAPPTARSPAGWASPSPRCSAAWARPPCRSSCPPASRSRRRAGQRPGLRHPGRASPRHPGRRRASPRRRSRSRGPPRSRVRLREPGSRPPASWSRCPRETWRPGRAARRLRTARSPAGMRGRCWPTPTTSGSARRRSWRPRCRPPSPGRGMTTWRC